MENPPSVIAHNDSSQRGPVRGVLLLMGFPGRSHSAAELGSLKLVGRLPQMKTGVGKRSAVRISEGAARNRAAARPRGAKLAEQISKNSGSVILFFILWEELLTTIRSFADCGIESIGPLAAQVW